MKDQDKQVMARECFVSAMIFDLHDDKDVVIDKISFAKNFPDNRTWVHMREVLPTSQGAGLTAEEREKVDTLSWKYWPYGVIARTEYNIKDYKNAFEVAGRPLELNGAGVVHAMNLKNQLIVKFQAEITQLKEDIQQSERVSDAQSRQFHQLIERHERLVKAANVVQSAFCGGCACDMCAELRDALKELDNS